MSDPNPFQSSSAGECRPRASRRARTAILVVVLLSALYDIQRILLNLPGMLREPDMTLLLVAAMLVFWCGWTAVELVAARWIWRGRAAGRWILVASFGLRATGQLGFLASAWPIVARAPAVLLAGPFLFYEIRAALYGGVALWLAFVSPFENRAASGL